MTIEEMKARLAEISNKLGEFKNLDNFTAEVVEEIEALNTEFTSLTTNIEAKEKLNVIFHELFHTGRSIREASLSCIVCHLLG